MFSFLVFCVLGSYAVQASQYVFESGEIVFINPEYINPGGSWMKVNDQKGLVTHLEIIKKIPADIVVQTYVVIGEAAYNEHREGCNICNNKSHVYILLKIIGIDPESCHLTPGIYGNEVSQLSDNPDLKDAYPPGKYLLNLSIMNDKTTFLNNSIHMTKL